MEWFRGAINSVNYCQRGASWANLARAHLEIGPTTSALFAALATCYGWHTIAHTLISQVAQLSLTASEKKTLRMLLDDWQPFFPNTSDLTTAAVWLDTAKCDRDEQDCKFASGDHRLYAGAVADRKFSSWHYADVWESRKP